MPWWGWLLVAIFVVVPIVTALIGAAVAMTSRPSLPPGVGPAPPEVFS